ncbi:MAG: ferrous iron transport protein A [Kiritimatiellaeota bacterium]|nr:ferrous iron transport protein A [Kiritimatiellota bacterium]
MDDRRAPRLFGARGACACSGSARCFAFHLFGVQCLHVQNTAAQPSGQSLGAAEPGRRLRVAGLAGSPALRARLVSLGLLPGTVVTILRRQGRGPLVLEVRGSRVALGRAVARHIQVVPAGDATLRRT